MELDARWFRVVEVRGDTPMEVSRHRSLDEARRRFRARGRSAKWRIEDPSGAEVPEHGVGLSTVFTT